MGGFLKQVQSLERKFLIVLTYFCRNNKKTIFAYFPVMPSLFRFKTLKTNQIASDCKRVA